MTREWFTTYCQNAAANVLDKDNQVRFTYEQLSESLRAATEHRSGEVPELVLKLHNNIVALCNNKHEKLILEMSDEWALLLTLLNIHAAYLMISGLWKEEPQSEGGTDEFGFEIF